MTGPAVYDLSNDAALFVAPPFGKLTVYLGRETYGLLRTETDYVELAVGVVTERRSTTLQTVRAALGEVPLDAHVTHDGRSYRVLAASVDDTGWLDVYQVAVDP